MFTLKHYFVKLVSLNCLMDSSELSRLSHNEKELLLRAPLLVCILIAGADGKIDDKEIRRTLQMAEQRNSVSPVLGIFFSDLVADFEEKLRVLMQSYSSNAEERTNDISRELAGLNQLWTRLSPKFSAAYYEMLKYFARDIAKSSGGLWRGKISSEEARLIELPMVIAP